MTLEDFVLSTLGTAKSQPAPDRIRMLKLLAWRNRERTRQFINDVTVYGSGCFDPMGKL